MARTLRLVEAGVIYHVLNRGNGRRMLFGKEADFAAFEQLLAEALERFEVDLLAYCLMGNHWHLLLRPRTQTALSRFMGWLTMTHARRHHGHYRSPGGGHLYQGRFRSFPVQSDEHFLMVARYIHANPARAKLVERAQDWRWSDLVRRADGPPLAAWPVDRPPRWAATVNREMDEQTARQIEQSVRRGTPFGAPAWVRRVAGRLGLESTLRPRGRPQRPLETLSPRQRRRRQKAENGQNSR
jgi:putative transposase